MTEEDPAGLIATWGPDAGAALIGPAGVLDRWGTTSRVAPVASVTKLIVGYGILVALEEGSVALDEPAGPPGATMRHLLAHASGLAFDNHSVLAAPGTRRIYSNTGFEVVAEHLQSSTGFRWTAYIAESVLGPLAMSATVPDGSPASGIQSNVEDLATFAAELLSPTLIDRSSLEAASTEQFSGLDGVLPGFGLQQPNPWGLAFELRGQKHPHWTGGLNSGATFGHFGGSGTFVWVDPAVHLALVAISGRDFGPWAVDAWPRFTDAVLAGFGVTG